MPCRKQLFSSSVAVWETFQHLKQRQNGIFSYIIIQQDCFKHKKFDLCGYLNCELKVKIRI